jgi:hypothetical protein
VTRLKALTCGSLEKAGQGGTCARGTRTIDCFFVGHRIAVVIAAIAQFRGIFMRIRKGFIAIMLNTRITYARVIMIPVGTAHIAQRKTSQHISLLCFIGYPIAAETRWANVFDNVAARGNAIPL